MSNSSSSYKRRATDRPEFLIQPYDDRAISQANYEAARKIVDEILPALRELRRLNWKVEVMDGF